MISFIYALIALSLLILVHECGHYLVARLFNVKVLAFSLGFGKKLLHFTRGETEYAISAVPLGGYVKLLGESPDEEVPEEEKNRSFSDKPAYVRILIALTGPLFNILFAFLLLYIIAISGYSIPSSKVGEVQEGSPAYSAGIKTGDTIAKINETTIEEWGDIAVAIDKAKQSPIKVTVQRDSQPLDFMITPKITEDKNIFGEPLTRKVIGIKMSDDLIKKRENPFGGIGMAFNQTYFYSEVTVLGIVKLIQGVISPTNIGGPILIFKEASKRAKTGLNNFIIFFALISINLGIINLLPIPILDGGHIFFNLIEICIRRKIPQKWIEVSQKVGLAILILIMVFAFYNDIDRIVGFSKYFHGR
jgi:regulator of sigma E protease